MIAVTQHRKKRHNKWSTDFTRNDVLRSFQDLGPMNGLLNSTSFSLSWFVSKILNNQRGRPLMLEPFQVIMLDMLWHKKFPIVLACRGAGKTFMLAVYSLLRAILVPGSKVVIAGAGYRQAKLVFKYIHTLYDASPIVQEACKSGGGPKYGSDMATLKVGLSTISAIPIGDGEKIRGLRATVLIADEFGSINEEVFEIVLSPFTAVHADPAARAAARRFVERLKTLGASDDLLEAVTSSEGMGNQVVLSGTATHKYNHFYRRYRAYLSFIESGGDPQKLRYAIEQQALDTTGKGIAITPDEILRMCKTYNHYAVFQLPYTGMPDGFLDEDTILRDKATFSSYRFMQEYMAGFPDDSDGFIRRSKIESATPTGVDSVPVELFGDPRATYVMGLDPARWNDNFGCVILKLTPRGKELVYAAAWHRQDFATSSKIIRELVNRFSIKYVAMDKGGGGDAVREWLCKKIDNVVDSELIWTIPEQLEDPADQGAPGRNILEMVSFGGGWTPEAAHSLEAAVNQQNLLFPSSEKADLDLVVTQFKNRYQVDKIDEVTREELSNELWGVDDWEAERGMGERSLGTWEHICETINETCTIIKDVTPLGAERFILPKLQNQPEGMDMRRRDRFSALMLANYAANVYLGHGHQPRRIGGIVAAPKSKRITGNRFNRKGRSAFFTKRNRKY